MQRAFAWTAALTVGTLAGAGSHLVGHADPVLTASVGVTYAVLARLAVSHPDIVYEEGSPAWAVGRWSGLSTGFVLFVTLVGVGTTLTIGDDLRVSLQILVFGAGWTMWALGVAYAREKAS